MAKAEPARARRALVVFAVLAALLTIVPAWPAAAHAGLSSSSPEQNSVVGQAPAAASLVFNEPVSPVPSAFQLYDPTGTKRSLTVTTVDTEVRVELPSGLVEGSYAISWRVVSADAHPISGTLPFSVGRASDAPAGSVGLDGPSSGNGVDLLYLLAQIAAYLGLMAAVGLTLFEVVVLRSVAASSRARERLLGGASALALLAYLMLVPLTLIRQEGGGLSRLLDLGTTVSGLSTPAGAALGLLVLGLSAMLLRPVLPGRIGPLAVAGLGTLIAVSSTLPVGHTRTFGPTWLMVGADLLHVVTGAMWFGGVVGLASYLTAARRSGVSAEPAAATVVRFSGVAGILVAALAATGTMMAILIVGSVPALFDTGYGHTLLAKLGFAAVIAVLALWNKSQLVPAVARANAPEQQWQRLRAAVRDEVALLVAVLCLTGLLVMQSPLASRTDGPPPSATVSSPLGAGTVRGTMTPARVGQNVVELNLRTAAGEPLVPLAPPQVTATLPEAGLGPVLGNVQPTMRPGYYRVTLTLPLKGAWQLSVAARVSKFDEPVGTQVIDITS